MGVGKTVQAIALASCFEVRPPCRAPALLVSATHTAGHGCQGTITCPACQLCELFSTSPSSSGPPPQDEWPLLVIVPASLRLVWAEELEKWLPHLRPSGIHVIEGKEDRVGQVRGAGGWVC